MDASWLQQTSYQLYSIPQSIILQATTLEIHNFNSHTPFGKIDFCAMVESHKTS